MLSLRCLKSILLSGFLCLTQVIGSKLERDAPAPSAEPCETGPVTDNNISNSVCGGMHFLSKIPSDQEPRGLFVLLHGCQKAAIDWFELPEEASMTEAVLKRGFAVAAVDSPPRPGDCWDWQSPADSEQLAHAIPFAQKYLGVASRPFYGIGVSSGGMVLAKMVHDLGVPFSGVHFNVAPVSSELFAGHELWPRTSFLYEQFDSWANPAVVQEAAGALRKRGTKVQVLKAGPKPVDALLARSEELGLPSEVLEHTMSFLRDNGFTNVPPGVSDTSKFLGKGQKEYLFANSADIAMNRLAQSSLRTEIEEYSGGNDRGLIEELHVVNGMHTATSEHFQKVLNFLLGPATPPRAPSSMPAAQTLHPAAPAETINHRVAHELAHHVSSVSGVVPAAQVVPPSPADEGHRSMVHAHVDHVTSCSVPLNAKYSGKFDYVCDTTVPWLHSDGSSWAPATPPLGTGCHAYVFLSGNRPACSVGASCGACKAPSGQPVFAVKLLGGSCAPC